MRFQKTTEYAIRVMVYLADNMEGRHSVNHLHQQLDISYKYLGRLMNKLAKSNLVDVAQGKQGGYRITKKLDDIYLYHIIEAVEGLDDYSRCVLGFPECSDENPCSLHKSWLTRQESIKNMVYNTSLADIEDNINKKY